MLGCSSPICQGEGSVSPVPLCFRTRGSTKPPMPLLVLGKAPSPPRIHRPQPGHQVLRLPPQRCCTSWRSNEPGAATGLTTGQARAQHLPGATGAQSQASFTPIRLQAPLQEGQAVGPPRPTNPSGRQKPSNGTHSIHPALGPTLS